MTLHPTAVTGAAQHMADTIHDALMESGSQFTCSEYESIVGVYRALGDDSAVRALTGLEADHVRHDDADDDHYNAEAARG